MKHILVVDDNKTNLTLVKNELSKKYQVTPVISGFQALKFLEKKLPDLILLDLSMPEMDGRETMQKIREREEWSKIPIIFLTADNTPETESQCLADGADDFIAKPFVPQVMHGPRRFSARFIAPDAKILIVDDNAINLKVAAGLMKPYNMKIMTASSGPEAIEAVKTKDIDIIFMDHMMPEMDGVEATGIIRNMPERYFKEVPIIALTANAVNGAREMFLGNGFNDFLPKPIETAVLDRVLRAWLPQEYVITTSTMVKNEPKTVEISKKEERVSDKLVNYESGLVYAGGIQEVYFDILKVYVSSSNKYKEELESYYEAQDWEKYTIKIHALKSSSISVGAATLSELAKEMEQAGKLEQYDIIRSNHAKAMVLYDKVVADIESYLEDNGYSTKQPLENTETEFVEITMENFLETVDRIVEACENFEGDTAIELAQKLCLCKLDGKALAEHFSKVKAYADDYEYELAVEAVKNAVEVIKEVAL